jgi:hypothetical protein
MRATTDAVIPCAGSKWRWRGWPLFHGHGGTSVATDATSDSEVSICRYGVLSPPRHDATSRGGLESMRYVFVLWFYVFRYLSIELFIYLYGC